MIRSFIFLTVFTMLALLKTMFTGITYLFLLLLIPFNSNSQIINGDFSLPGNGDACIAGTGWTTATGNNSCQYTNLLGPSTNYWIDLTPCWRSGNGSYIEQTVKTDFGKCYHLEIDLGTHYRWDMSDAGVYVTINGTPLGSRIYNDNFNGDISKLNWETRLSNSFIATSTTTVIRFTGEGRCTNTSPTSGPNSCTPLGSIGFPGVMGIDNIKLVEDKMVANPSIDTGYYCKEGDKIKIKALNLSRTSNVKWSVVKGASTIEGNGDSINVIANGYSQILMKVIDTGLCPSQSIDTIHILPLIETKIDIADIFCVNDSMTFSASFSYFTNPISLKASWDFGDRGTSDELRVKHSYSKVGVYDVALIVTLNNSCIDTLITTVNIDIKQPRPYINVGPSDTTLCTGESLYLPLGISVNGVSYLWSDGSADPLHYVNKAGLYIVQVSNDCGTTSDTINVKYKNCSIWFPSGFSPNGDGLNDIAKLIGVGVNEITNYELSIYNRWGNNVFQTNNVYQGWDGIYKGKEQPVSVYFYYIKYTLKNKDNLLKGDISLIR